MNKVPTISVVIPVYNAEPYLRRCIASVLAQTFLPVEIIVVDDGSTDASAEIAKTFSSAVQYVYQKNGGASAARNTGIINSRGDWIAFLDVDDQWRPHHLANAVRVLQSHPDLRWYGAPYNVYLHETGKVVLDLEQTTTGPVGRRDYFEDYLAAVPPRGWFHTGTMVIHKAVFNHVGLFDPEKPVGEDLDMWFRIGLAFPKIGYGPTVASNKYERSNSLSRVTTPDFRRALKRFRNAEIVALEVSPDARRRAEPRIMYWVTKLLRASLSRADTPAVREIFAIYGRRLAPRWRLAARVYLAAPWATRPAFWLRNTISVKQRAFRAAGLR